MVDVVSAGNCDGVAPLEVKDHVAYEVAEERHAERVAGRVGVGGLAAKGDRRAVDEVLKVDSHRRLRGNTRLMIIPTSPERQQGDQSNTLGKDAALRHDLPSPSHALDRLFTSSIRTLSRTIGV